MSIPPQDHPGALAQIPEPVPPRRAFLRVVRDAPDDVWAVPSDVTEAPPAEAAPTATVPLSEVSEVAARIRQLPDDQWERARRAWLHAVAEVWPEYEPILFQISRFDRGPKGCVAGAPTIAEKSGVPVRRLRRHLASMVAAGLIVRVERRGKRMTRYAGRPIVGGANNPHTYTTSITVPNYLAVLDDDGGLVPWPFFDHAVQSDTDQRPAPVPVDKDEGRTEDTGQAARASAPAAGEQLPRHGTAPDAREIVRQALGTDMEITAAELDAINHYLTDQGMTTNSTAYLRGVVKNDGLDGVVDLLSDFARMAKVVYDLDAPQDARVWWPQDGVRWWKPIDNEGSMIPATGDPSKQAADPWG